MKKRTPKNVQQQSKPIKVVGYTDLPINIRNSIDNIIEGRRKLGLFDDSRERKERAVSYCLNKV